MDQTIIYEKGVKDNIKLKVCNIIHDNDETFNLVCNMLYIHYIDINRI